MASPIFILLILACAVVFGILWFRLAEGVAEETSRMDFTRYNP